MKTSILLTAIVLTTTIVYAQDKTEFTKSDTTVLHKKKYQKEVKTMRVASSIKFFTATLESKQNDAPTKEAIKPEHLNE